MKNLIYCLIALFGAVSCREYYPYPGQMLDIKRLSSMTPNQIDQYAGGLAAEELIRPKRSGSSGFISQLSSSITSGISKASAGASSFVSSGSAKTISSASGSSSGSSSSGSYGGSSDGGYEYTKPASTGKGTDFFSLKKSILNTIFQALKAITGGVTILKGQLIKGGGALTSGVGNLISVKGEAVANLGRHLVNTASLSPAKNVDVHHAPSAPAHYSPPSAPPSSYGPPPSYGPPSSPSSAYDSPSPPLTSYGPIISSHGAPSSKYGGPNSPASSFIPPSSSLPVSFAAIPSANTIHSSSNIPYPSHPNAVYLPSPKHVSHLEAFPDKHDYSKYQSPNEAFFTKNLEEAGQQQPQANYISSEIQHPQAQLVTTAVEALYGILKPPANIAPTAPAEELTLPTHLYDNNLFHPPPPPPPSKSTLSYVSYSDYYAPFKPLSKNLIQQTPDKFAIKSDSDEYGSELSGKLTEMIDDLLGVKKYIPHQGFHKVHPLAPIEGILYDSKSSHSSPSYVLKKPGLDPVKLSKVNDNLDKLQEKLKQNWGTGRSLSSPFQMYDSLSRVLKAIQDGKEKKNSKVTNRSDEILMTQSSEYKGKERRDADTTSLVQKSLVYELRGNRLIKLTDDEKTDNA